MVDGKALAVRIRPFEPADLEAVTEILKDGVLMYVPSLHRNIFRKGPAAVLAAGFVTLLALGLRHRPKTVALSSVGFLFAFDSFLAFRAGKRQREYFAGCVENDLADMRGRYAAPAAFWVASGPRTAGGADEVLGCIGLAEGSGAHLGWGQLQRMSVAAWAQRRGVARRLNDVLVAEAVAQGLKGVFLTTGCHQDPALRLYESLGYKKSNELRAGGLLGALGFFFVQFEYLFFPVAD